MLIRYLSLSIALFTHRLVLISLQMKAQMLLTAPERQWMGKQVMNNDKVLVDGSRIWWHVESSCVQNPNGPLTSRACKFALSVSVFYNRNKKTKLVLSLLSNFVVACFVDAMLLLLLLLLQLYLSKELLTSHHSIFCGSAHSLLKPYHQPKPTGAFKRVTTRPIHIVTPHGVYKQRHRQLVALYVAT